MKPEEIWGEEPAEDGYWYSSEKLRCDICGKACDVVLELKGVNCLTTRKACYLHGNDTCAKIAASQIFAQNPNSPWIFARIVSFKGQDGQ